MARTLKLFNGRAYCAMKSAPEWEGVRGNAEQHAYIAAYSREDARRVVEEYCGRKPSVSELRDYFSPCWGNAMEGIAPERGLWLFLDGNGRGAFKAYPVDKEKGNP